ncbi:hypothetical protein D9757_009504 [Collybiopsis confluens]|uniref:Major facilitator superfamily (MFS) profile domain-containing protein n=1 Tax=Collybiopsis confluens TaxID=2823264 RepID=A0A8H5H5I0_9AGAR|nr:hypothetical protein D9757_009504 [Collybiopsis confluens]
MGKGYHAAIASNPYIVGSFACIGGGLFGLDISSMSGVLTNPYYLSQFHNLFCPRSYGAAMPAGSFIGALAVSQLGDRLGRKKTIMLASIIWVIGSILQCASVNRGMLVVGRIISGLSVGISSTIVPVYQSEITAPAIRGRMVSLQQWSITWGILIQYFIQFGSSYINGVASFRLPWGLQMIPAIILFFGMIFSLKALVGSWTITVRLDSCFENDFLTIANRDEEALEILADVHGGGDKNDELVRLEFEEIKQQVIFEQLKGNIPRRVFLGSSLQMWSQLSGMNVMMYYIVYVFQGSGLTGTRAGLIAASVQYVLNVVATVPAIIYIDKWGRRPMLILGSLFMGTFLYLVGGLQARYGHWGTLEGSSTPVWLITGHDSATKGIIVCSYLFVCSFAVTMGPVSWTYPAEIYSLKTRGKAVSIATATNWIFNFALAWATPPGFANIAWKTYYVFGTFNFAAAVHFFFMFPETVGRTLEEIEDVFNEGHTFAPWKIGKDTGKKTLADIIDQRKEHSDSIDEKEQV